MRRFIYGTPEQFEALDRELQQGINYKYEDCRLPGGTDPAAATLWIGRENGIYILAVKKGIRTESENSDYRAFLAHGGARFASMDEMREFFYSLRSLDPSGEETDVVEETPSAEEETGDLIAAEGAGENGRPEDVMPENAVDKERLHEILKEESRPRKVRPEMIAAPLKKKVFGQDEAIDELSSMTAVKLMQENRGKTARLLPVMILGPTATGKSETARSLARVLTDVTGSTYGCIDIAGSELQQDFSVQSFFGAPPGFVGYGKKTKFDPVRKNPYQVIIIDEIEKATPRLIEGLMEAIDTGILGMADNSSSIDLNHCIMLFTSNLKIDMAEYARADRFQRNEICRNVFTEFCGRPEISSKIGNFIAFMPLSLEARVDIVTKFMKEEVGAYGLRLGHIDERLMADFLKNESRYGARDIRLRVRDTVGNWLVCHDLPEDGQKRSVSLAGTCSSMKLTID